MPQHCKNCKTNRKVYTFRNSSFLSAILIILIPKCPFCIMAYSSAITICGGQDIYMASNNWVSFIPLILSVLVLLMILLNRKGARSWVAVTIAAASILCLFLSHQLILSATFYNVGSVGLLLAIWINGNLLSFVRQLFTGVERNHVDHKQSNHLEHKPNHNFKAIT